MADIAKRYEKNPILSPGDLKASEVNMDIECLLNPGVFEYDGKTWLLIRVAERTIQKGGVLSVPIYNEEGKVEIIHFDLKDPKLNASDARVINYDGVDYLTTISHLRLVCSKDGIHFYEPEGYASLFGEGEYESYGIEDCRVVKIEDTYHLSYTMVSANGVGVGLRTTKDWKHFEKRGMIFSPHNKDCAIFEEKIDGKYYALHRPSSPELGGNYMWLAQSPDGIHWGNHKCIAKTRAGKFDSHRLGAGAAPIKTEKGWLEIYHGATEDNRYCLGAILLDLQDPSIVLARSEEAIMEPMAEYEQTGFFGNVVFTNGHITQGDTIQMYYGASDEYVCKANFSIQEILSKLDI
ncbi:MULTISPECIES: glycoside hydrolase family 130 protein [unclassified Lentimicrobium]|uniref:glycoside hydrolase family 130 protein n=1 Tax=unclassified Lentimicrobium TaxID=2677434 RepID=UPI0015534296|nr:MULTISPECIES: glycoside hydrolase family 130 protein [unclassified Lentimicrobium]NPD47419.1 glycosidase [Lentimicrobium sp. S6]NPD85095.1 glycosidase [Lentimicrobium sp. L6]